MLSFVLGVIFLSLPSLWKAREYRKIQTSHLNMTKNMPVEHGSHISLSKTKQKHYLKALHFDSPFRIPICFIVGNAFNVLLKMTEGHNDSKCSGMFNDSI